jgi:transposase
VALSDGTLIDNPKFLKRSEKRLSRLSGNWSFRQRGSPEREKTKKVVAC